jgi:hypothetical protein
MPIVPSGAADRGAKALSEPAILYKAQERDSNLVER